jgi:hypothetical protein
MTPDFVRSLDCTIDIAANRFVNLKTGTKFGRNPQVDTTSDPEDVWEGGGDYTGHPVGFTPETVDVFSDTGFDNGDAEGAHTVRLSGLTDTGATEYTTEDITLNGVTPVTSVNTWWRINRVLVLTAGANAQNEGTITVRSTTTTANVFASMLPGYNQTLIGAYTVPHKKNLIVKRMRCSMSRANGAAGSATITFRARPPGGVYNTKRAYEVSTNSAVEGLPEYAGDCYPAGTDLKFRVESVTDNGTFIEGVFEWLEIYE